MLYLCLIGVLCNFLRGSFESSQWKDACIYAHTVPLSSASPVFRKLLWQASALKPKAESEGDERSSTATVSSPSDHNSDRTDDAMQCPICFDCFSTPILQCANGHSFCEECIVTWVEDNHNCAVCRVDISTPNEVRPRDSIDDECLATIELNGCPLVQLIRNRAMEQLSASPQDHALSESDSSDQEDMSEEDSDVSSREIQLPRGVSSVKRRLLNPGTEDDAAITVIQMDGIQRDHVLALIEFLYSGSLPKASTREYVNATTPRSLRVLRRLARYFDCPQLGTVCDNIADGSEEFNPSIGTWLNDLVGRKCAQLFLDRYSLAVSWSFSVVVYQPLPSR